MSSQKKDESILIYTPCRMGPATDVVVAMESCTALDFQGAEVKIQTAMILRGGQRTGSAMSVWACPMAPCVL